MARGRGELLPINTIVILVFIVIIGLFLFGKLFEKVGEEWEFKTLTPDESEKTALTVTQILIIGAITLVVFYIAPRFGMDLGRRSAFSLILVIIISFLVYRYLLHPILTANLFSGIDWKLAQKLGLL